MYKIVKVAATHFYVDTNHFLAKFNPDFENMEFESVEDAQAELQKQIDFTGEWTSATKDDYICNTCIIFVEGHPEFRGTISIFLLKI